MATCIILSFINKGQLKELPHTTSFSARALSYPLKVNQNTLLRMNGLGSYNFRRSYVYICLLIHVINSFRSNQMYYMFGFLFLVFLILVITCSETTILLCYFHLCAEVRTKQEFGITCVYNVDVVA